MKKSIFLLLMAANMANNLAAMKESENIVKSESLLELLPRELVEKILTLVGFNNANSFEQILEKLKTLEKNPLFSSIVNDKTFIVNLEKIYTKRSK